MAARAPHQRSPRPHGRGPALRLVSDEDGAQDLDPGPPPHDATRLRAISQVTALGVAEWPPYGSPQWLRLSPQDPRTYAATLEAAELHRTHIERIYAGAYRQAEHTVRTAADARAAAARTRTMRTRAPHTLTPTPGWPPIAIPGQPGQYLTLETSE
jgi:hypothetical protein